MSVSTVIQKQVVDSITSVVITDIAQDTNTGFYVREIRVFDNTSPTPVVQFTLRLVSPTQSAIELVAPAQSF